MGQYYQAQIIDRNHNKSILESWDTDNGAKLMEHSYIGNRFVNSALSRIFNNPCKVAWVGDYSEIESGLSKDEIPYEVEVNVDMEHSHYFLVNHTKKLVLDIDDYINCNRFKWDSDDEEDWCIHPLPLLTAFGNGLGGGDYHGTDMEYVGSWGMDEIELTTVAPEEGYANFICKFIEG